MRYEENKRSRYAGYAILEGSDVTQFFGSTYRMTISSVEVRVLNNYKGDVTDVSAETQSLQLTPGILWIILERIQGVVIADAVSNDCILGHFVPKHVCKYLQ